MQASRNAARAAKAGGLSEGGWRATARAPGPTRQAPGPTRLTRLADLGDYDAGAVLQGLEGR